MNRYMYRLSIKLGAGWLIAMECGNFKAIKKRAAELRKRYWVSIERI